jgi:hypothetical protein
MIQHICANCETVLHSADGLGGTPIRCWKCHATVVVPPKSVKGLEVPRDLLAQAEARAKDGETGSRTGIWQSFKELLRGRAKKKEPAGPPPVA